VVEEHGRRRRSGFLEVGRKSAAGFGREGGECSGRARGAIGWARDGESEILYLNRPVENEVN
jgi:hypothetical protein